MQVSVFRTARTTGALDLPREMADAGRRSDREVGCSPFAHCPDRRRDRYEPP